MADKSKFSLFGFKLNRSKEETPQENIPSFTVPPNEDGATTISSSAFYSQTLDLDGVVKNEVELITRYREMSLQPEIDSAIEDIINEAIVQDDDGRCVDIVTDTIDVSDKLKAAIEEEFDNILTLLNFKNMGSDIFRRYYVDGRLNYHVIINNENPKKGIQELRYIDPRKIRKIREVKKQKDTETGISVITGIEEYYVYNDKIVSGTTAASGMEGIKIAADSVVNVTSGLMDARRAVVLSYLHRSIKPLNQLRMIEDASIIYKLCLVGDTRIKTNDGWKYIKDIKEGDVVYSYYGPNEGLKPTKVVKQWKTGKKQTYKVSSMHHQIVGSDNHPILVLDRQTKTVEYVDIKDLIPKRHAFIYEKPKENNEKISFPEIRKEHKKLEGSIWTKSKIKGKEKLIEEVAKKVSIKKTQLRNFLYELQSLPTEVVENIANMLPIDISNNLVSTYEGRCSNLQLNLPEYIDEEFSRLFGFMIGDGSVGKNTLVFAEGIDEEQNLYYAGILKKYFGECKKHKSKRKYTNYTTSSTLGAELFKKLGFVSGSKNKRIPKWLYECSDSIKKAFIIGLSDADGHTSQSIYTGERYSTIELSNKQLVEDIKEVWNSIGLYAGKIGNRKRAETFRTVGDEPIPRLMKEHESWSVRVAEYPIQQFENIISIEEAEIEDVYEIEVESEKHNFVANGIIVHNSRAPSRRIFYVNVGDMPKVKAEQYLRDMMTKYKNKIVYDACLDMNTLIPLLDGRTLPLYEIQKEFEGGKELWAYSCDPTTGKFAPGLITSAGTTKFNQEVMKITFDNGKSVTCTLDHKFPVWEKGKVEAKDLQVGDSMVPYYTREKEIASNSNSKYQQIFENESKKWKFTHRLVSEWKDVVLMNNEWTFDEEFSSFEKKTIHHIDYNRANNSPLNLTRMYRDDHFCFHKQHNSLAGKIGGPIAVKKQKELGIGIFGMSHERRVELGKVCGAKGGKKCVELKKGIHGLSKEETLENSLKGVNVLRELMQDENYRTEQGRKISEGFTEEGLERLRQFGLQIPVEHFAEMSKLGNKSRWSKENSKEEHSEKQTALYCEDILSFVEETAKLGLSNKKALEFINDNFDFSVWIECNSNKKVRNKDFSKLVDKDLQRISNKNGFKNWSEYKDSFTYKNHKITNIEFLDERMDVGTLGIDKNEIYHNYHTFALDCGVFTCNSTGQIRDDRKHLSILEDFWIPRRADGTTTEVKTLESNDNFSNMDMVEYFQRGLYKSLNVPVSRIDSQGAYNIGRSAEISREEIKFAKFIDKLRRKFSGLFDQLMRIQLVLKGVCTLEEWEEYKEKLYYDFIKDNNYTELKEAELMQGRLGILAIIDPYTGKYFSKEWIQRNVLRLNDDVILEMEKQIEKEKVEDLKQQEEDQKNQIVLQAQGLQLQNQLMPQPDQQIDAGAEEEQPQEEPKPRKPAHPYEV